MPGPRKVGGDGGCHMGQYGSQNLMESQDRKQTGQTREAWTWSPLDAMMRLEGLCHGAS